MTGQASGAPRTGAHDRNGHEAMGTSHPDMHLSIDEALARVLALGTLLNPQTVPFTQAYGRVLAQDVTSDIDVSPFDNSAMDGFALRAADVAAASAENPVALEVIDLIGAGSNPQCTVQPGQCARIMTGAVMPAGADAVVKIESTNAFGAGVGTGADAPGQVGGFVQVHEAVKPGRHVRKAGEEVQRGGTVLTRGSVVDAAAIGLMAATGNAQVSVYRRPVVGIIATGSELVDVTEKPGPGQIRNSNSYTIAAQAAAAGAETRIYPALEDTYEATYERFKTAAQECDLIVTSGGVSVGDFDFVRPAIEALGTLLFCRVALKPGHPQVMGKIGDTVFFGLPGNPSASYVGFEVFLRPLIRKMQGFAQLKRPVVHAALRQPYVNKSANTVFLRGRVFRDAHGAWQADVSHSQSSALLTAAHEGNAFVLIPPVVGTHEAGATVECWLLKVDEDALD